MLLTYIAAYVRMRLDDAGHLGAKQYAQRQVVIARRWRIEKWGRL